MAAHVGQPTRSRRFIKVYLMTWALLAVGAVAYLTLLAYPQPSAAPPRTEKAQVDPVKVAPAAATAAKALAEVQGGLTEIRKDVTHLKDAMGERVANEKVVKSRITALEERVATIEPGQTPPATAPTSPLATSPAAQPPATNAAPKPADKSSQAPMEVTTSDILARTKQETAAVPPGKGSATTPPPAEAAIQTGSLGAKDEIVFGEAVVIPANKKDFAVQLAAGPSLQVLRQSWGQLLERHGSSLAALKPRIIAPRSEGGIYRLLAGPVPTKADADRICAELGGGPKACFVTAYGGSPL